MNWKRLMFFWLVVILTGILMLALLQHRMIYHPRSYGSIYQPYFNGSLQRISYQTAEGTQTAFYQPPSEGNLPKPSGFCLEEMPPSPWIGCGWSSNRLVPIWGFC